MTPASTFSSFDIRLGYAEIAWRGAILLDAPTLGVLDHWFAAVLHADRLRTLTHHLDVARSTLETAISQASPSTDRSFTPSVHAVEGVTFMPNPVLDGLASSVESTVGVMASAETLINGFAARVQAAVDKALENGATAEQLAPVTEEIAALNAGASSLAQAVAANPGTDPVPPVEG